MPLMKKRTSKIWARLLFLAIFGLVAAGGAFAWLSGPADKNAQETQRFVIARGAGTKAISQNLQEQGLIKNALVFQAVVKKEGVAGKIQAGSFELSPAMTARDIAHHLTEGTNDIWITIPEGWRREEIAQYLAKQELDSFDPREFEYLTDGLEGQLFPDTYLIPRQMSEQQIVDLLTRTFTAKVTEGLKTEIATSSYDFEDALIMASIVEREARGYEEMRQVAGVLWNRIEIGMALQADATMQYAKGYNVAEESWWVTPLAADRQINSPYNTYQAPGLPPAPIASPGLNAIRAALNPTTTDALYYIHDAQGNVYFARTLDEHNANVNRYLRR